MVITGWLRERMRERAQSASEAELGAFVAKLGGLGDRDVAVILAVATAVRVNMEENGVVPAGIFHDQTMPESEALARCQLSINKLVGQFERLGKPLDAAGARVWTYSLRALNVAGLRPLGRALWAELVRGFPHVEAALRDGEAERGRAFPERVWGECRRVPAGLEPGSG